MKLFSATLLAAAILYSTLYSTMGLAAEAVTNGSEYQHQAPSAVFELTPRLNYTDRIYNGSEQNEDKKTEFSGPTEGVIGEYGINQMFSFGIFLQYIGQKAEVTPSGQNTSVDIKGLMDPDLFFNGRYLVGGGSFRFGTHVSLAIEKLKVDSNGNRNGASGGTTLTPFIGYEIENGFSLFGARLTYEIYKGDRSLAVGTSQGTDIRGKLKDGAALSVAGFYEYNLAPLTLGAAVQVTNQVATKVTDDNGNNGSTFDYGHSVLGLSLYAPLEVAARVRLLSRISYSTYTAYDSSRYTSINELQVDLGARFSF